MDQSLGRLCKLMAKRKVLADVIMKGDSAGYQHILEEFDKFQLPLDPVTILEVS